jgi:hypothetical protein
MVRVRPDAERIWRRDKRGEWQKPTSTHRYPLFRIIFISVLFLSFIFWFWYSISAAASAAPAFDHTLCQYPHRLSNPPDGCDNTDPSDPAAVVKDIPPVEKDPPRVNHTETIEIPMSQNIEHVEQGLK